ncbi:MAG TPA: sulfotransferase family 2 domain-containing protein [Gemmataceae bacterium]|nr:sulfotransferase family 2 domain-containing protein [Gemmataceae bacterium]
MISHEHRCIFVHIPRCGGTSIEEVLWPGPRTAADLWMGFVDRYHNRYQTGGLQHLLARQIEQEVGRDTFSRYFKFAFVRNPFDRAVSQYHLTVRRAELREFIGMGPDASFRTYLSLIRRKKHVQWEEQYRFLTDERGNFLVDYVGRFENFETDARKVFDRLGIPVGAVPHSRMNRTAHRHYAEYYDAETAAAVRALYARDLDLFGYSLH